jgi:chitodextrinase
MEYGYRESGKSKAFCGLVLYVTLSCAIAGCGNSTTTSPGSADLSSAATVTTSDGAPTAPTGLTATTISSSQISLSWTASTDNVGVTGYRVYRAGAQIATSSTTSYSDTGLTASTLYSYTVAAYDAAGNVSPQSASASATTQGATVIPGSATVPGAITAPNPTLNNITIEWEISGDTDNNGVVSVRYRRLGDGAWSQGMPLRRVPSGASQYWIMKNKHSGSILDLQPNTTYEIELSLYDPNGGSTTRTTTVTTRPVPVPMAGAPIKIVTPSTWAAVAVGAQPGDILDLAPGTYAGFTFPRNGSSGQPIVIRASSAGVIINGTINLDGRQWVYIDGLSVNGMIRMYGSSYMAVMRSTINTTGDGIVFQLRSENNYIADNRVIGVTPWAESSLGVSGNNVGEGIQGTGPGHVIMHNFVQGFRDGISTMEAGEADDQYSIDILNNDINVGADDAIEADYCFNNCRVMRNRITNSFMGVSSQPTLGGPQYIIRNVMYNVVFAPFKLHNGTDGDVILHNTIVKNGSAFVVYSGAPISRLYTRNNLFIGGPGGTYNGFANGNGQVMQLSDLDRVTADLNYDAFGSTLGTFSGNFGGISFSSLSTMRSNTTEKNAVQADLGVFATTVAFPSAPMAALLPAADLRIGIGSSAENAGVIIPNVTDGFLGSAPDIGAYETGVAPPVYGPR